MCVALAVAGVPAHALAPTDATQIVFLQRPSVVRPPSAVRRGSCGIAMRSAPRAAARRAIAPVEAPRVRASGVPLFLAHRVLLR